MITVKNRHRIANLIICIFGTTFFCKIQELIKYLFTFRKDYNRKTKCPVLTDKKQRVVFMIDGKTIHGGLSDRIRGLLSVYHYCKLNDKEFRVCFINPFYLEEYLNPNKVDWLIKYDDLSFCRKEVSFRYFNSYCNLNNKEKEYFNLLHSSKKEIHVYSNVTIREDLFKKYFDNLFLPTDKVLQSLNHCLAYNHITSDYVSITFRFIGILGDFQDHKGYGEDATIEQKELYIKKCRNAIEWLHHHFIDRRILVTADSNIFLNAIKDLPYIFFANGKVQHCDFGENKQDYTKPFTDLFLIARAQISFGFYTGKMFASSKFALTASLIGGHKFTMITDTDIVHN